MCSLCIVCNFILFRTRYRRGGRIDHINSFIIKDVCLSPKLASKSNRNSTLILTMLGSRWVRPCRYIKPANQMCALAVTAQKLQGEQGRGGVPLKLPHLHKAQGRGKKNLEAGRQEIVQIVIVWSVCLSLLYLCLSSTSAMLTLWDHTFVIFFP